jgi:hypothetical protein
MALTVPDPERDHISGSVDGSIRLLEYGEDVCGFFRKRGIGNGERGRES